ncbi:MAG TPA: glycosyltransferase [Candidatus Saccharimonadales bacterium]|nr:glycosyltransferase [Candidatus Saccharimonadales bacterium]
MASPDLPFGSEYAPVGGNPAVVLEAAGAAGGLLTDEFLRRQATGSDIGDVACLETVHIDPIAEKTDSGAEDVYRKKYDSVTREVSIESDVTEADYEAMARELGPGAVSRLELLKDYAQMMQEQNRELTFVNATAFGGGVAIMRAPLIHMLRTFGVNARWYALKANPQAALVTKRSFHNVLQNVDSAVPLSEERKMTYETWIDGEASALAEPLSTATDIVIDDWQPSRLIPHIKGTAATPGLNPEANLLFRDHIHTEGQLMVTEGTPQYETWQYIWGDNRVSEANYFITHPRKEFLPPNVPLAKNVLMPATIDTLDSLNKRPLTPEQVARGREVVDRHLLESNEVGNNLKAELGLSDEEQAINWEQRGVDWDRPYIVLIARFDPSKGMDLGMEAYVQARQMMIEQGVPETRIPQLLIIGNGSVDDPDGKPELAKMMRLRNEQSASHRDDIKIARMGHDDEALNAVLGGARLALQPSTKEGFEDRVTSAIWHYVSVLGSDRGGIPLQIIDGESGYIMDPHNTSLWAERIYELTMDEPKYQAMRRRTRELATLHNSQFTTVYNAASWLYLCLKANSNLQGNGRRVTDIIEEEPIAA